MSRERLAATLAAAARSADGGLWTLQALAAAPGCTWQPETRSLLGRVKSPASLQVGQWRFAPSALPGGLPAVRVVHEVGGVRLAETAATLEQCAGQLADAVCGLAESLGPTAAGELQAVVAGLERAASA